MGDKNVLMRPEDMEAFDIQCDMTGWESEEFDPRRMRTDQAVTTATVGRTEREVEDLGQERMCRVYRLREVAQSAIYLIVSFFSFRVWPLFSIWFEIDGM